MAYNFDPAIQNLTLYLPQYGPQNITIGDVDQYVQYGIRICINYASQIGASALLFVVLLLTTKPEKRYTPINMLNTFALLLNVIRLVLACLYFTGPYYEAWVYLTGDYSRVPVSATDTSIAVLVLTMIVIICLEVSLFLQVKAVTVTLLPKHRFATLAVAGTIGVAAAGFRLGQTIADSIAIHTGYVFGGRWLLITNNYLLTASICIFSLVFDIKLACTIYQRRKFGLRQFGPVQICFIIGFQTMIIPAIFAVLQNVNSAPELGSQVVTVTLIFLPLSSLWAASKFDRGLSAANSIPHSTSSSQSRQFLTGWFRKLSNGSRYRNGSDAEMALDGPRKESASFNTSFSGEYGSPAAAHGGLDFLTSPVSPKQTSSSKEPSLAVYEAQNPFCDSNISVQQSGKVNGCSVVPARR